MIINLTLSLGGTYNPVLFYLVKWSQNTRREIKIQSTIEDYFTNNRLSSLTIDQSSMHTLEKFKKKI